MKKTSNILITISFLLFLLLPQAGLLFNFVGEGEEFQNRKLSPYPEISAESVFSSSFGLEMNSYIWDHFPLRSDLLKIDHWIDYHIFKDSPVPDKVLIGKEDTFFIYQSITKYPKNNLSSLNKYKEIFTKAAEIHRKRKPKIFFVFSPSKASLYPEFLPDSFKKKYLVGDKKFRSELEEYSGKTKNILLLWDAFNKRKNELSSKSPQTDIDKRLRYLFRPYDQHFHWETAIYQAKLIVDFLAPGKWKGETFNKYFTNYKYEKSEIEKRFFKIDLPEPYKEFIHKDFFSAFNIWQIGRKSPNGLEKYIEFKKKGPEKITPLNKNLVVIHDSFLFKSKYFITPFFKRSVFIKWKKHKVSDFFIPIIKNADIILLHGFESHFFAKLKSIEKILDNLGKKNSHHPLISLYQ
ncbi:MAG: hypothetical protein ABFR75_14045 [Acidobacteriota bacterium]